MEVVDLLLRRVSDRLARRRAFPEATYRLQFHAGFTFRDALEVVPYLRELGITHCYASSYLKARPGSTHGYDVVDHSRLNPEIGSDDDYRDWIAALHAHGLGQILDTVPNHVGVATNENAWWNDVLENGPASRYAGCFDIAWEASPRAQLRNKVLLPVLGEPYGDALEAGKLRLTLEDGAFAVAYHERRFPVNPRVYGMILGRHVDELEQRLGSDNPAMLEYHSILTAARNLPERSETDPARLAERQREKEVIKRRLAALLSESAPLRAALMEILDEFNGQPGDPRSFDLLDQLLDEQCYRLSYWRVASDEINYRRFFDINDLAALSIEREDVFEATHRLILDRLADGSLDGLRIDHPDGLYDPAQYFRRLQQGYIVTSARREYESSPDLHHIPWADLEPELKGRTEEVRVQGGLWPLYVAVEKILEADESLPDAWRVHGTTGYEFVNLVNGLFIDREAEGAFNRLYADWTQEHLRFGDLVFRKKLLILQMSLASELHMLTYQLDCLAQKTRRSRDFTFNSLRDALERVIACFPVYRSYISEEGVHERDRKYVDVAIRRARSRTPLISRAVFDFIRSMLLMESPESFTAEDRAEQQRFAGKFQQVTSPVTAKGIEDTVFYVFNRMISLNEVGGNPARFGVSPKQLHDHLRDRQVRWPHALSPLSTHDTKRSEDVRARLNVLSEIPELWRSRVERWRRLNAHLRQDFDDVAAPDPNEEYLLYQSLVGVWPLEALDGPVPEELVRRVQNYMTKALHEAKVHTSWINPNPDHDGAVLKFVGSILDEEQSRPFLDDFRRFVRRLSHFGLLNSLAQTVVRITSPGAPDTYQGTELWDFSLVDPDNRRPVDYVLRSRMLQSLPTTPSVKLARELIAAKTDGRVKLYVTWRGLRCCREHPGLFSSGEYVPVETSGSRSEHVFAFMRRTRTSLALVAVPRLFVQLNSSDDGLPLGHAVWEDTHLLLPNVPGGLKWKNLFTGETLILDDNVSASSLFQVFPVAVLTAELPA